MTVTLASKIQITKLSAEVQGDGYPFEAIILSGEPIDQWYRFVIDLSSIAPHKPRLTVDYNHNDELIIGYGENFQVTPEGLKSSGKLIAGTFADEIVKLAKEGVPFEASVVIDLSNAIETRVGADSQAVVNGRTYQGPISVFSNVPLEGFAICPHGADKYTTFTLLKKEIDHTMPKNTPKTTKKTQLSVGNATDANPDPEKEVKAAVKSQELADFCSMFGEKNGLALFQSGADIAEAKQWQALNEKYSKYLADDEDKPKEDPADDPPENVDTEDDPKKEEEENSKLSAVLTKLSALDKKFETELTKLKASIPRGAEPVSHASEKPAPPKPTTSIKAYAAAKCRNVVVKE